MDALFTGIVAGYGIAIPVGAIAVLILKVGIKCGFKCAVFAGAGAATADFFYAALAVVGGAALAGPVAAIDSELRYASAAILIVIALVGFRQVGQSPEAVEMVLLGRKELAATYGRFLALTIVNPTTIVYFAAVIIGLGVADGMSALDGALFSLGAFLASFSWQTLIAGVGAFAGGRMGQRAQSAAIIVGNIVILAFALIILVG